MRQYCWLYLNCEIFFVSLDNFGNHRPGKFSKENICAQSFFIGKPFFTYETLFRLCSCQKQSCADVLQNSFLKFCNIHWKTPVFKSLLKNCLSYRTPPVAASDSSQFKLYILYVLNDYPVYCFRINFSDIFQQNSKNQKIKSFKNYFSRICSKSGLLFWCKLLIASRWVGG